MGDPDFKQQEELQAAQPGCSPPVPGLFLRLPLPASLFLSGFPSGGHGVWAPEHFTLGTVPSTHSPLFVRMFLYQCAWVCRDSGLSCCGIFISLPGSAFPPLCLTKPVHCFLFIVQDSQGGGEPSPGEAVGRQGPSLGMDEIMSALFFNFLKNKRYLI